ncbi:MAG: Gfo/Idh/MocA family protein [Phycisphaeraceae bacterium]
MGHPPPIQRRFAVSTIRCGVIGAGGRSRGVLVPLRRAFPEVDLRLVHDPDPKAVASFQKQFGDDIQSVDDPLAVARSEDVDWVFVFSPNHAHMEHAVTALDAGKHLFCEKPLALSFDDAIAIREAQLRNGGSFVLGFTLRFSPHYRRIASIIEEGGIGRPISFEFNETLNPHHGGYIHSQWRRQRALAGTHMLEKCCHDIDIANWFAGCRARRVASFGGLDFFTAANAGHVDRIGPQPGTGVPMFHGWDTNAFISAFNDDKDIFDNQVALIEYESGLRACFHTNACSPIPERRIMIIGEEGAIRADVVAGRIEHRRIGWNEPTLVYEEASGGHGGGDEVLAEELKRCMLEGVDPAVGVQAGLEAAVTVFAIDRAADEGRVVDLTEDWQRVDATSAASLTA